MRLSINELEISVPIDKFVILRREDSYFPLPVYVEEEAKIISQALRGKPHGWESIFYELFNKASAVGKFYLRKGVESSLTLKRRDENYYFPHVDPTTTLIASLFTNGGIIIDEEFLLPKEKINEFLQEIEKGLTIEDATFLQGSLHSMERAVINEFLFEDTYYFDRLIVPFGKEKLSGAVYSSEDKNVAILIKPGLISRFYEKIHDYRTISRTLKEKLYRHDICSLSYLFLRDEIKEFYGVGIEIGNASSLTKSKKEASVVHLAIVGFRTEDKILLAPGSGFGPELVVFSQKPLNLTLVDEQTLIALTDLLS